GLLLIVGSTAAARARVAGVVAMVAGVVVGAAIEVLEAVEVVAVMGVVAGWGLWWPRWWQRWGWQYAEGGCYLCVPPDPCIEAAALGASESALPGTALAEALHTLMLDSGASRCFFQDSTTLTPLSAPVPVRLADPSGGPVLARSSTVLPCQAVPSGSLSGLHLPSFSTKLSEGLGFESQCVQFGHPSAGGCQRSTGDPRLILGKGYRLVVLGGYGRTDPLVNKPFYPNGLVTGILTSVCRSARVHGWAITWPRSPVGLG
ncbi:unnamed protein product, partial [Closterium sp. NIES-54]